VDPAADPDGDSRVDAPEVGLVGRTSPGATVRLDRGADGTFEATTTADAQGLYRFALPLSPGANPVAVEAVDSFGQRVTARRTVTRGPAAPTVTASFDFRQGALGWQSGFADLPIAPNETYELAAGIRPLPPSLGVDGTGYLLQSHNRSDDVFMFLKRRLGPPTGSGRTRRMRPGSRSRSPPMRRARVRDRRLSGRLGLPQGRRQHDRAGRGPAGRRQHPAERG
jgi:hypothetical protein